MACSVDHSRRNALKFTTSAPLMLNSGLMGGLTRAAFAQTASATEYGALVAIFMFGGNDGNNLLIPLDVAGYSDYQNGRGRLALSRADLHAINPTNTQGRPFALHPSMGALASLFETGQCAAVANVGRLVQPLTRAQWQGNSAQTPTNLFSHSDQQSQWQAGTSETSMKLGWGGRAADVVASLNGVQNVVTAIAVNGRSGFRQGATVSPFLGASNGNFGYDSFDATSGDALSVGFGEMNNAPRSHLFEAAWNDTIKRGITTQAVFQVSAFTMSDFGRDFPANGSGGSDDGWGNQHLVLGGAVKGKQLYGTFPTLRVNGPDDTSGGR